MSRRSALKWTVHRSAGSITCESAETMTRSTTGSSGCSGRCGACTKLRRAGAVERGAVMAREVRIAGQEPDDWSAWTRAEFAAVDEASLRRLHLPSVLARHPTFLPPYMTWAKAIALH